MFQLLAKWFDYDHKWHIRFAINGCVSDKSFTREAEISEFIQDTMQELR